MIKQPKKFIVNEKGKRVEVVLDIKVFQKLMAEVEELECIRAYDQAKASGDEAIPFEKAKEEIERRLGRSNNPEE